MAVIWLYQSSGLGGGSLQALTFCRIFVLMIQLQPLQALGEALARPTSQALHLHKHIQLSGLVGSAYTLMLSSLGAERPLLVLGEDADEAGYLYADIEQLVGKEQVFFFPSAYRKAIKYGHRDEGSAMLRTMLLSELSSPRGDKAMPIIVSYPEALMEAVATMPQGNEEMAVIALCQGDRVDRQALVEQLLAWGYERVDYVYDIGQFALRGSILDVYAYASELPYRLDFFDDELESLRCFEVESQLSVQTLERITLTPDLASGQAGAEHSSLLALLPEGTILATGSLAYASERMQAVYEDAPIVSDEEGFASLEEVQRLLLPPRRMQEALEAMPRLETRTANASVSTLTLETTAPPLLGKDYEALVQQISQWQEAGNGVYIASAQSNQYERICEILLERAPKLRLPECLPLVLHEGFIYPKGQMVILTEHQIFGRFHKYNLRSDKARSGKMTLSLKELSSFAPGDLVVHSEHGIGRFGGLVTMPLGDRTQEVVKIEYNKGDSIYVGLHSLHKLSRYRQKEDAEAVTLSTLGTGAWQRLKERTKKQVKDIARDLIRLYAKRKESEGFAYSPDTYLQHELEASFAWEPTPDQLKATQAIKEDMERPYPMDRLLCGDVGFGKTEVAIRAAFKAVADSRQVALLVPTTVLAYQHYRTFSARLKDFPARVEYLSRARTTSEIKRILTELAEGKIDIIIGTHRLTSKDVRFKSLGLLIVDEEQKFGVAVKEKLRKLQVNVDTLTMSATPIPRTLQFSLMGARDLSNINTPPANRIPVETIRTRFSAQQIAEAINFELSRNGQVYFIHNRIQNIEELASLIRREVPEVRLVVGHGQMSPTELEEILIGFANYEYDVLLSTTIIENGIDVPNANTIMINDAHRYGLSELHQLRGRVGRSHRKAFCYLLTPPVATLREEARRRLRAIENFSDLGSGVRIALQDLDIRGAGNALGAEQSGFIADMGYETYQKVFNEAVNELKASEFAELYASEAQGEMPDAGHFIAETAIESDLELHLPESYVPSDNERILLYRELDELSRDEELEAYRRRLIDRFGQPPALVEELIAVPRLRRLGRSLGVEKVILRSGLMSLHLPVDTESRYYQGEVFGRLLEFVGRNTKRCEFRERNGRHIIHIKAVASVSEAIALLRAISGQSAH